MAKTAKEKLTNNTGTKTKKSTSRKTVSGKSTKNELPSSTTRSRGKRTAHCGAVLSDLLRARTDGFLMVRKT